MDYVDLIRRVCRFLGVEIRLLVHAKQFWMIDVETGNLVVGEVELKTGILQDPLLYVPETYTCNTNDKTALAQTFFEHLATIKRLNYGLDSKTLEPKKTTLNPFFGVKSLEEIAIKLDLLEDKTQV